MYGIREDIIAISAQINMEKKIYLTIRYMSTYEEESSQVRNVKSAKEYKDGTNVIVRHKGKGVFIGQVIPCNDNAPICDNYEIMGEIDLNDYIAALDREKKKAEIKEEMIEMAKELDKIKKYEIYASMSPEFAKLLEEYKGL